MIPVADVPEGCCFPCELLRYRLYNTYTAILQSLCFFTTEYQVVLKKTWENSFQHNEERNGGFYRTKQKAQ